MEPLHYNISRRSSWSYDTAHGFMLLCFIVTLLAFSSPKVKCHKIRKVRITKTLLDLSLCHNLSIYCFLKGEQHNSSIYFLFQTRFNIQFLSTTIEIRFVPFFSSVTKLLHPEQDRTRSVQTRSDLISCPIK